MTTHILIRSLDRGATLFLIVIAAIAILVPVLNLALPESSAFHIPTYLVALFGKYACYALLALSIDLIWGFCGILSLGHGAFFRARRLRHGHVSHAPDRHPRRLCRSDLCRISWCF